jgi:hypothetical protein
MAAKRILEQQGQIFLPAVMLHFNGGARDMVLAEAQRYSLQTVTLEQRLGSVIPDVVATVKGRPLLIEIRVTHAVDNTKLQKLRQLGISAIEVDLSAASRSFDMETLKPLIVDASENKSWLHNTFAEQRRQELFATGVRKPFLRRGFALHVDDCPIPARVWKGRRYANVVDDCAGCVHALDVDPRSVLCNGHLKDQESIFSPDG